MINIVTKVYFIFFAFLMLSFTNCTHNYSLSSDEKNWLKNNDSITVALFPYYKPYQFLNENGDIEGILVDYLSIIEDKINYKFKKRKYSIWPQLLEDAKNGCVDVILEIQKIDQRTKYLNFLPTLFETKFYLVTNHKTPQTANLVDFEYKTIALPEDFAINQIIKEKYPLINIVNYSNDLECLKHVQNNTCDGWVGPKAIYNFYESKVNLSQLKINAPTEHVYDPRIAITQKNDILTNILSKGLQSMSEQEKGQVLDTWLFHMTEPYYKRPIFWLAVVSIILLIAFCIILFNIYLKYIIRQKTKELQIAKENAEKGDRIKDNFLRNISHEIRTPMNGIIGFSEFLANPNLTSDEQKEYTNIIIESSKQLLATMEDILEISRLKSKKLSLNIERTNLSIVLQSLYLLFEPKAEKKKIQLILNNHLNPSQKLVLIDKSKLRKILMYLIDNGIKFTDKGNVTITVYMIEDMLFLTIEDTGIGIHKKDQKEIFSSFSQSEKEISKNHGGLGLGLTIAKENIAMLGGTISLTSKKGIGTRFVISIPHIPLISEKNKFKMTKTEKKDEIRRHLILIAEDGEINFLFLKTLLIKMEGFNFLIYRAKNGSEAVDLCKGNDKIDLVLMDIKMPVMDGYMATKKIKKIRPNLPIIAQTAYSTAEDLQNALNAGCDDFISKPIDSKLLQPMISKYFSKKKAEKMDQIK